MRLVALRWSLVALAAVAPGCLLKPDRVSLESDAGIDGATMTTMVPRLISKAYFSAPGGMSPAGMSASGFEILTSGIADGDLVLFIANIDNGSTTVWPTPIAQGFHQIAQEFFGSDGQTYVASWKIADHEPDKYAGGYGAGRGSSAATITLLAIAGADPIQPINTFASEFATAARMPTVATSTGVETTVPNTTLIYAAGADWLGEAGSNTVTVPDGFTKLAAFGDKGGMSWDWTSQMVAYRAQPAAGLSGPITGTLLGSVMGMGWTVVLAIAPASS